MPNNLRIEHLDDMVYEELCRRAERRGVSVEEEVRRILTVAVVPPPKKLGQFALECFGPYAGVELETHPREPHGPPDFSE